ncbi:MAG: hypothetical protein U9Q33_06280 [Campylobacterota bacterium]|nr:hypothetical protein [Campylobacterota bacterium]
MYTVISLLIFFLIAVFGTLLYFKSKKDRLADLQQGICPACGSESKTFKDQNTGTTFKVDVIKAKVLRSGGCSGVTEIEYKCSECGLKEVHNSAGGCGL